MSQREPALHADPGHDAAVREEAVEHPAPEDPTVQGMAGAASPYEPVEDEEWPAELPPRPRRRLLTPLPLALLAVLLTACGFIGGVLVEKSQGSSSSPATGAGGFASRLATLRGGGSGTAARSGAGAAGGGPFGSSAGAGRGVSGQVAYLAGSTLYVTNSEGNTVKVGTSAATSVTKTVKASVKAIHPGETVTVIGATASNGAVSVESISVGSGGGFAALFGGSATGRSAGAGAASGSGGGGPALFGNGG